MPTSDMLTYIDYHSKYGFYSKPSQKIHITRAISWYKNKLKICINILHKTVIKYAVFSDNVSQNSFYTIGY